MKALAFLAVIVGCSMAAPAKLDGLDPHQHHHHHDDHHHDHHHNDPLANVLAQSSRSGYDYEPPAVPSGLYEVPTTTTTTTTTPPPPPPPPVDSYLPPPPPPPPVDSYIPPPPPPPPVDSYLPPRPDETPQPAETVIVSVGPTTTMMPMPYDINWGVQDLDSGNRFSHVENSDGTNVKGEYSVLLPDNRLQIVRFTSDPINGYQAEVFYEPA